MQLTAEDHAVGPVLVVLDGDDEVLSTECSPSLLRAFDGDRTLTIVADYVYWFGVSDAAHTLTLTDMMMTSFDGELGATLISQPAWIAGDDRLPSTYFAFEGHAGKVVTLHATTTTGETIFEVKDATLQTSFGWFRGISSSPLYEGDIRFYCHEDGLYVLSALDLSGAVGDTDSPDFIASRRFSVTASERQQVPVDIGSISSSWSLESPAEVTSDDWERFFLLDTSAEESLVFDVTPLEDFNPTVGFYDANEIGPLTSQARLGGSFPRRFPDAGLVLFGIADASFAPGSFDLLIETLPITEIGPLSESSPVEIVDQSISSERIDNVFQFEPSVPGLVTVTVTPSSADDLVVIARDEHLEELQSVDLGAEGEAESLDFVVTGGSPAFVDVVVDAALLPTGSSLDLDVSIEAFSIESEPNDEPMTASVLTLPETIAATLDTPLDQDWFKFSVEGASTLVAETIRASGFGALDTRLILYDAEGTVQLDSDDDGGDGYLSLITSELPDAGEYYLMVESGSLESSGDYFLSAEATLR